MQALAEERRPHRSVVSDRDVGRPTRDDGRSLRLGHLLFREPVVALGAKVLVYRWRTTDAQPVGGPRPSSPGRKERPGAYVWAHA